MSNSIRIEKCTKDGPFCANLMEETLIGPSGKGLRAQQWIDVKTRKVTLNGVANFKTAGMKAQGTLLTYCPWCGENILPTRAEG